MLDTKKLWPFGLSSGFVPRFIAIVLLIFSALVFLDVPTMRAVELLPEWLVYTFSIITRVGDTEWILLPSLFIALACTLMARVAFENINKDKWKLWATNATFVFLVTAGPGLLANIIKRLIGRARPVHLDELGAFHFQPVLNDWTFQSIPSGHASTMFAFATGIMLLFPKLRWWALGLAALVGLSRIVIGVHYPTDVFAGVIFGIIAAFGVRNICLSKGWVFVKNADGEIVRRQYSV